MTTSELQKSMGRAIKRVIAGETITLTTHGSPVAMLVPVGGPESHEDKDADKPASGVAGPDARADGRPVRHRAKRNLKDRTHGRD